jgi:hypothetical protein
MIGTKEKIKTTALKATKTRTNGLTGVAVMTGMIFAPDIGAARCAKK